MLQFAADYPEVMRCLPIVEKETLHLPRAYIANVIHTVVGRPFEKWVKSLVNDRHEKLVKEKQMEIEMDEEIAEVYR